MEARTSLTAPTPLLALVLLATSPAAVASPSPHEAYFARVESLLPVLSNKERKELQADMIQAFARAGQLERATKMAEGDPEALERLPIYAALGLEHRGDVAGAIEALRQIAQRPPRSTYGQVHLVTAMARVGAHEEALQLALTQGPQANLLTEVITKALVHHRNRAALPLIEAQISRSTHLDELCEQLIDLGSTDRALALCSKLKDSDRCWLYARASEASFRQGARSKGRTLFNKYRRAGCDRMSDLSESALWRGSLAAALAADCRTARRHIQRLETRSLRVEARLRVAEACKEPPDSVLPVVLALVEDQPFAAAVAAGTLRELGWVSASEAAAKEAVRLYSETHEMGIATLDALLEAQHLEPALALTELLESSQRDGAAHKMALAFAKAGDVARSLSQLTKFSSAGPCISTVLRLGVVRHRDPSPIRPDEQLALNMACASFIAPPAPKRTPAASELPRSTWSISDVTPKDLNRLPGGGQFWTMEGDRTIYDAEGRPAALLPKECRPVWEDHSFPLRAFCKRGRFAVFSPAMKRFVFVGSDYRAVNADVSEYAQPRPCENATTRDRYVITVTGASDAFEPFCVMDMDDRRRTEVRAVRPCHGQVHAFDDHALWLDAFGTSIYRVDRRTGACEMVVPLPADGDERRVLRWERSAIGTAYVWDFNGTTFLNLADRDAKPLTLPGVRHEVAFIDARHGVAIDGVFQDPKVWTTDDGGRTWSLLDAGPEAENVTRRPRCNDQACVIGTLRVRPGDEVQQTPP